MNAPLKSTGSLKTLAQARLEQTSGAHLCRTFARTFAPEAAHISSGNGGQTCGGETALLARCKTVCEGLPIEPTALYEALDDEDRTASPSLEALKAFAESLADRVPKALPAGVSSAYTHLKRELAEHPDMRFACETLPDEGGDYVKMAVGVKGAGFAVLRMAKKKFDPFRLLELSCRWNPAKLKSEGVYDQGSRSNVVSRGCEDVVCGCPSKGNR